ncbi:hypothetical protein R1flu_024211 [Riccia fluitans]|uniref:LAGLIDADG homing endonuclease n=1 Tax=Riccia fluitans TaxID=41844 RepID=A0ABD1XUM9_9MARC
MIKINSYHLSGAKEFRWAEGSSRLALLASFLQKAKVNILPGKPYKETIKRANFQSVVRQMEENYKLDLRRLSDADLLIFLEAANWEEYHEFRKLETSIEERRKRWSERKSGIDKLKGKEEEIL